MVAVEVVEDGSDLIARENRVLHVCSSRGERSPPSSTTSTTSTGSTPPGGAGASEGGSEGGSGSLLRGPFLLALPADAAGPFSCAIASKRFRSLTYCSQPEVTHA